jgi:hypothetical protein
MKRKLTAFLVVIGIFAVFVASCDNESEENRAVVIVSSINENLPFFSDVLEQGDTVYVAGIPYTVDDFISEDYILVTFYNRPYNNFTTTGPGDPLSDFLITRYTVDWRRVDGGDPAELLSIEGATSIQVPSNTFVSAAVLLVPFQAKNSPALQALQYSPGEILAIAHITFWGHEVGTNREWSLAAEITVNFGDWIIETDKKKET